MSLKLLKHRIEQARDALDSLELSFADVELNGGENKEEFLDSIEAIFLELDDMEDILDRDHELKAMKKAMEEAIE